MVACSMPVPDFPGYHVTDDGRVYSEKSGKWLKPYPHPVKRYYSVSLSRESKSYPRNIHILVMLAFHGSRPEGMEVCHNNGDRQDNRLENLRWDTHRNNLLDRQLHGNDHQLNKTHCPQGHPYSGDNLYIRPKDGGRECNTCRFNRNRAR